MIVLHLRAMPDIGVTPEPLFLNHPHMTSIRAQIYYPMQAKKSDSDTISRVHRQIKHGPIPLFPMSVSIYVRTIRCNLQKHSRISGERALASMEAAIADFCACAASRCLTLRNRRKNAVHYWKDPRLRGGVQPSLSH
jgi:hypothetical protein